MAPPPNTARTTASKLADGMRGGLSMTSAIRSFTTRSLCGLFATAALAVGIPTAAFADHRDDWGGRGERHYDHGRDYGRRYDWRGRDHGWGHDRAFRGAPAVYWHGPSCGYRPGFGYGYRPYYPHGVFFRSGWYFGR